MHTLTLFAEFKGRKEEIIPLLQKTQNEYSYLPPEMISAIARFTRVPEGHVYGVATFYAQFRFKPKGRNHAMVCRGTACHVNGADQILSEIQNVLDIKEGETTADMEYSLETVACIGACSLAPCVMVNDSVEAKLNPKKVRKIFKVKHDESTD